jgi:hypothetical protein
MLHYTNVVARDANGRLLPASITVESGSIALTVNDAEARYPIVIDPLLWAQQQELLGGASSDMFGESVAISGSIAIVGASGTTVKSTSSQGAAFVFAESDGTWALEAELVASDGGYGDLFGSSVSISGTTAIVGTQFKTVNLKSDQGAAYIFTRSGGTWTQQATLHASDGAANDSFGTSVAISDATAIVGAAGRPQVGVNDGQGAAYVYTQVGSSWTEQQTLLASDGARLDGFGGSVAIDGATAIVGARFADVGSRLNQGAAYIFTRSGGTWTQQATLHAADGAAKDLFGASVAISGTTAVVSAPGRAIGSNAFQGVAYVFTESGGTWTQQGSALQASDGAANDWFGSSVGISGTNLAVGSRGKTVGSNAYQGVAYHFTQTGGSWIQYAKLTAADGAASDAFGSAVAISGTAAVVGAPNKMVGSHSFQGATYLFVLAHPNGELCSTAADCLSGHCVEGVCCDSACGTCRSCLASRNGSSSDGACGLVASGGSDPACTGTACTSSGSGPNRCNGAGACGLPTPPTSCGLYVCDLAATACLASCAADTNCVSTAYCASGVCTAKKGTGAACSAADQCGSGFCVDGVCCATACSGTCQACSAALTGQADGTCTNVSVGQDPHGDCPGTTCSGGTLSFKVCNGAGACGPSTASCPPSYACDATGATCAKVCTTDVDCGATGYCNSGTCSPKGSNGQACTTANQCTSASCADGVCCNEPCAGQCQACNEPTSVGTCIAVKGTPRAPRTACNGTDAACAGTCDGTNIAACAYPSSGQTCGTRCSGSSVSRCDGTGTCLAPTPCPGNFICSAVTNECGTACVFDADCAASFVCVGYKCQTKPSAKCSPDGLSSIPANDAGPPQSCAPYTCGSDGNCATSCGTDADCTEGASCDTAKSPGQCGTWAPPTSSSGGCSCEAGAQTKTTSAGIWIGLLGLVALSVRRKRAA